ncbi:MAG: condensation domain-containing protein, partial [Pyrinomonadaceae bacterium]
MRELIDSLSPEHHALLALRLHRLHTAQETFDTIRPQLQTGEVNSFPMSYAQESLWLTDQLAPGNPLYNMAGVLNLTGTLNVKTLEQSLGEIVRRHEVLRASLCVDGAKPVQVVSPARRLRLTMVDLTALPAQAQSGQAQRLQRREA